MKQEYVCHVRMTVQEYLPVLMRQEYIYVFHMLMTVQEYLLFMMKQEYVCHVLMTVQELFARF